MAIHPVLLMTKDPATSEAVASALASNGQLLPEDVFSDLTRLGSRLAAAPAPAALIDIDSDPAQALHALEQLCRRHSQTRFIVVSSEMRSDLLLEAMQAGARHYLRKEAIGSELSSVLHRVCPVDSSAHAGSIYTVLSAGGGCGTTTVAVNLASELNLATSQPALIVDLDPCYGGAPTYLGLDGNYGILDLLERDGPIDGQLITSSAHGPEGLKTLCSTSEARRGDPHVVNVERLKLALAACRAEYGRVVIDAPRLPLSTSVELARLSARTFIVLQLSIKDIAVARRLLRGLTENGVARESVTLLVNRYHKRRSPISLDDARRAIEHQAFECLSSDYQAACESANMGKPLSQSAPRSTLRREIEKLAATLVAAVAKPSPQKAGR